MSAPHCLLKAVMCVLPFVLVTGAQAAPTDNLSVDPSDIPLFNGSGAGIVSDSSTLSNSGNAATSFTITPATQTGGSWLSASAPTHTIGVGGSVLITINADTSHLIPGNYTGTVKLKGTFSTATITVELTVSGVQVSVSPNAINLGAIQPQKQSAKTVTVTATGGGADVAIGAASPGNWLTADKTQIAANSSAVFHVTVDATSLPPASYSGTISLQCTAAPCIQLSITVTFSIAGVDNLSASPAVVPLGNGSGSGVVTGSSTLSNLGTAGTTFAISSTTVTGGSWLSASATTNTIAVGGSVPITIHADTSYLIPGNYTGTVKLKGTFSTATITVNLTVNGVQMSVSPNSIDLGNIQPAKKQSTQITITSTGAASLDVGVATYGGSGWLTTDKKQVTANLSATFNVIVDTSLLSPGAYQGTVSIRCTAAPCIAVSAPVVFNIAGPTGPSLVGSMPHLAAEENWITTFTLVNKGSTSTQAQLNLFGDAGDPSGNGALTLPLLLPQLPSSAPVVTASLDQTISANASLIIETSGPSTPPVLVGSAQLASTGAVDGFAIFHQISTAQEAVVPIETRNASSYLLAFDNTGGVVLGVAVENLSVQTSYIPVIIRDDTGAVISAPGSNIALGGNGHTQFDLSTQFPVTTNIRGTIEFDTPAGGQISVLGLRFTPPNNALTTIPALANVGTGGGSMAHLASGGDGWQTTFVLVNTETSPAQATLSFFADLTGAPLPLPLSFPQSGTANVAPDTSVTRTLAAGATLIVVSSGAPQLLTGSAQLTTTGNVSGFEIFRHNGQEAVVPLESRNAAAYVIAFDNTNGTATGLAVNAVSTGPVNISVVVRDDMGAQIATDTLNLAANGHLAFTLIDKYPMTSNIRGTIEFDKPAGVQIGALGIRIPTGAAHTYTTLPALKK
jgi:Viral BACON domain